MGEEGFIAVLVAAMPWYAPGYYVELASTALIGALLARFRPKGMARTLVATAGVQVLVGVIALAGRMGYEAIAVGSVLAVLWLLSAWLFRQAAGDRKSLAAIGQAAGT